MDVDVRGLATYVDTYMYAQAQAAGHNKCYSYPYVAWRCLWAAAGANYVHHMKQNAGGFFRRTKHEHLCIFPFYCFRRSTTRLPKKPEWWKSGSFVSGQFAQRKVQLAGPHAS